MKARSQVRQRHLPNGWNPSVRSISVLRHRAQAFTSYGTSVCDELDMLVNLPKMISLGIACVGGPESTTPLEFRYY